MLFASTSFAQKRVIANQIEVKKAAVETITKDMQSEGGLFELKQEYQITGVYVYDITIKNKGEVISVFAVRNEDGTIPFQNRVKDYIKEMKMGFKMPKNKSYKFRYKFNFNN
jgi:hypothetical protein